MMYAQGLFLIVFITSQFLLMVTLLFDYQVTNTVAQKVEHDVKLIHSNRSVVGKENNGQELCLAEFCLPGSFEFICVPQHKHKGTLDLNSQSDLHVVS